MLLGLIIRQDVLQLHPNLQSYIVSIKVIDIFHFNEISGVGCDHAKFQPGMCWYRMLPEIELTREVEGKQAELLQTCFSPGVIEIVTSPEG